MYMGCTRGAHGGGWLPLPDHSKRGPLQVGLPEDRGFIVRPTTPMLEGHDHLAHRHTECA
jgi:hypothetical protein